MSILDNPTAFAEHAQFSTPTSRLFPNSWCPNLDVYVLVTRIAGRNHLVLRSLGAHAEWDVELEGEGVQEEITGVCWSPDGTYIIFIAMVRRVLNAMVGLEQRLLLLSPTVAARSRSILCTTVNNSRRSSSPS